MSACARMNPSQNGSPGYAKRPADFTQENTCFVFENNLAFPHCISRVFYPHMFP